MRVAVVGGGIQGCTVALELARRGVGVTLFDRRARLLDGASRHSEGKVHLGYVYAADESLRTAGLMAEGAAAFAPALRRWIGSAVDAFATSRPFNYAVHRGSLLSPDTLELAYAHIDRLIAEAVAPGAYFGEARPGRARRLAAGDVPAYGDDVEAVFETAEIAVDPDAVADALASAVEEHASIAVRTETEVVAAEPDTGRLRMRDGAGGRRFDHIVNCAWDGRVALDATAGVEPPAPWSFRMKYFARLGAPEGWSAPPTTVVLGSFGDVVDYGDEVYLSWYPVSRRGWSLESEPPRWPTRLPEDEARRVREEIGAGLAGVLPQAHHLAANGVAGSVRGGVIYALGDTDVSDRDSTLHERSRVGPQSHGSYHTIDTGKSTLAPLFAMRLADRIAPHG